jgi:HSP20 family protein
MLPIKKKNRNELDRFHDEIDDLFHSFLGGWGIPTLTGTRWPALDIAENEDTFVVKAEIPGCKPSDIDISVHGNTLIISGEKKHEEEKETKSYYHVERSYGEFRRLLNLTSEVNYEKIEASYKNGVLTLTLPKSEKAKAVKVKIKED